MENPKVKIATSKGDMIVELYEEKAPNTVANIITLAESGFYKDMAFHRILKGFMAQGGCPNTKPDGSGQPGTGGPGYTIAEEFDPELRHNERGILSMAKTAAPNSTGCQFFILFGNAAFLDDGYSVFGKVIEGLEVIDELEAVGHERDGLPPKEEIRFSIEVVSKNDHDYAVKKA
ncbi:MAG: peptidylprolyl isomerase [Lentisphaeraceae bacterium]|nr:peptidylprolyl isomerase [Lentisphaeraceae bacterium]